MAALRKATRIREVEIPLLRAETKALPELALIPLWAPLAILWDQFITSWYLSRYASVWSGTVRGLVAAKASVECLSPRIDRCDNNLSGAVRAATKGITAPMLTTSAIDETNISSSSNANWLLRRLEM
jgi:hypothetical protein